MRSPVVLTLVVLLAAACSSVPLDGGEGAPTAPPTTTSLPVPTAEAPSAVTTTGLDGNRVHPGLLDLDAAPTELPIAFTPTWLVAAPVAQGVLLVATDGDEVAAWVVGEQGPRSVTDEVVTALGRPPATARPALVVETGAWRFATADGPGDEGWTLPAGQVRRDGDALVVGDVRIEDALPDARLAVAGDVLAVPVRPTDRYGHAVLGDGTEAAAVAVADLATGSVDVVATPGATVLEGTGVVLADVDDDGGLEVLATLSADGVGAAQAILDDGAWTLGPPIGLGNRWRHTIGVADGRVAEIVTPHLARTFQWLDGTVGLTPSLSVDRTVASHRIGSRNLDLAVLVDTTGDGLVDLVGPAAGDAALLVAHDGATGERTGSVALGAGQSTNLVVMAVDGVTFAAVGTEDDTVVVLGRG